MCEHISSVFLNLNSLSAEPPYNILKLIEVIKIKPYTLPSRHLSCPPPLHTFLSRTFKLLTLDFKNYHMVWRYDRNSCEL